MLSFRRPGRARRAALALSAATAVALTLAACSSGGSDADAAASASSTQSSGPWTYTDDIGTTVELDQAPTRVVGFNDALVPLMDYGLTPVGNFGYSTLKDDQRFNDLDTSSLTTVGTSYGEINLETLAELKPDVIVTVAYPTDSSGTIDKTQPLYGFKDLAQQKQVEKIAPIITITMGGKGADVIDHFAKLSEALGADPGTIAASKKTFDAAASKLTTATEKNDVTVTAMYADSDGVAVAHPADDPALELYQSLGVRFWEPAGDDYYWSQYSWENATKVQGDVFLQQQTGYSLAELRKQETFASQPALVADQVHPWLDAGMDYVGQARYLEELTSWITAAKPVSSTGS